MIPTDDQEVDEFTCSICDALGHGYQGTGPCPLEELGYDEARAQEDYEASWGISR